LIPSEPKVSIIIVNYNGTKDTLECLESLEKTVYKNYEIIIVDNCSISNERELLKSASMNPNVSLIFNESNQGFAGGNNIGIQKAIKNNSDFILLLNNDTIVDVNFLYDLVENFDDSLGIGILTPKILFYSNHNLIWSAGGFISKIRSSGFPFGYRENSNLYKNNRLCTFATGCCMMLKKELVDKIGYLNENYFLYLEDTDYSLRTINAGFKIYYVASSIIYHKVQASTSQKNNYLPIYYSIRNRLYFAKNNFGIYYYFTVVFIVVTVAFKIMLSGNKINYFRISRLAIVDFFNNQMGRITHSESMFS
jgi:GT2 family glycosyltransferase